MYVLYASPACILLTACSWAHKCLITHGILLETRRAWANLSLLFVVRELHNCLLQALDDHLYIALTYIAASSWTAVHPTADGQLQQTDRP